MTVRKVNNRVTMMWAQCLECGWMRKAHEGTGIDGQKVVNLRRRMADHTRRTGHAVRFNEQQRLEGRFER